MKAKEYLGQIKALISSLKSLLRQVQSLDEALTGDSAGVSDMPGAATPNVLRMEMLIANKIDLERMIEVQSTKLSEIINTINSLKNHKHTAIITARYVAGIEWRKIAYELKLSGSHLYRLHHEALVEFNKLIANGSE
jgi:DNA-directed RNA polymerase specialized sigma subunit